MKKIAFLTALTMAVVLIISTTSCKEDWLTPLPENQLVESDSTFFDNANAEKFVNACYGWATTWGQSVFSWIGVSSISSDDADKGSDPGDLGTDKDQMDNLTWTPTSLSVAEVWEANYTGIGRCNQAIDKVNLFPKLDDNLKSRYVGEAKFMRAFYYFNLVRLFGDVPKITKAYSAADGTAFFDDYVRAPKADVYALIEEDLKDAAARLPLKNAYGQADVGRATKGAALGMLAKVYMYQKKWSECLAAADEVVNSGQYSLLADYATIWRQSTENGSESLFEIQGQDGADGWGIGGYFVTQGARGKVDNGYGGWGFNTPTDDLLAAFESGDKRKAATYYSVGQTLWDGAIVVNAANTSYNYKAYVSKDQEVNYDEWWSGKNIRVLRYAEILLIQAEAANELNQTQKAKDALNAVRARAGLSATTATDLKTAIWNERRVELALEHDRWFDLVRQGRAGQVMRAHGKNFVDGKHEVFPVPQGQIDISNGRLIQNSGY